MKTRKNRKSIGSAKKAASRKSNSSVKVNDISSDDDTAPTKKRGRVSAIPVDASDVDEPKPTKKKAKTQAPVSKSTAPKSSSKQNSKIDMEPKTSPEPMETDQPGEGHVHSAAVSEAYMSRKSWEDLVDEIVTVERRDDATLIVFWTRYAISKIHISKANADREL